MRVRVERTVTATPDLVWTVVGDESSWLRWYRPLSLFQPIGEPTSGVGATFDEHESFWKTRSEIVSKVPGRSIGLATRSINLSGLLDRYYRSIDLEPGADGASTTVSITGAFRFGWLGLLLFPYTYPQMNASIYLEYRSALRGLAALFDESGPLPR